MNVIKQIVKDGKYGVQTIKQIVRSNERGARGEQGEKGEAATITAGEAYSVDSGAQPAVMNTGTTSDAVFDFYIPKGENGLDGAIHYTAGTGIGITPTNEIYATGEARATWGSIIGDLQDQEDLVTNIQDVASGAVETAEAYTDTQLESYTKTSDLPEVNDGTLTITNNGSTLGTFTANSSTNQTVEVGAPVITMSSTDPGEGSPLEANHFIFVYTE